MALRAVAMACGGEGGARLAERLGMRTSPDTMLREIRKSPTAAAAPVRVVGIDDWALRRGQRYGTIIVDLEKHRPVDLLPERSSTVVRGWLVAHPTVEIVSRDRGEFYIQGATAGAPRAIQVADRWHLLHNLRDALERLVEHHRQPLEVAAQQVATARTSPAPPPREFPCSLESVTSTAKPSRIQELSDERRAQRLARYQKVLELHQQKVSQRAIARRMGLHRETVANWLNAKGFPERVKKRRTGWLDTWATFLERRWNEGCRNAAQLAAELREQGFHGPDCAACRYVAPWRKGNGRAMPKPRRIQRLSPKSMAWLLFKSREELTGEQQLLVQIYCQQCPVVERASALAREFADLVRQRRASELEGWLSQAAAWEAPLELRRFAAGLIEDLEAVRAALSLPWSNGQTEGQVNRLKLVKRQMYGRANFDLLRRRFLAN